MSFSTKFKRGRSHLLHPRLNFSRARDTKAKSKIEPTGTNLETPPKKIRKEPYQKIRHTRRATGTGTKHKNGTKSRCKATGITTIKAPMPNAFTLFDATQPLRIHRHYQSPTIQFISNLNSEFEFDSPSDMHYAMHIPSPRPRIHVLVQVSPCRLGRPARSSLQYPIPIIQYASEKGNNHNHKLPPHSCTGLWPVLPPQCLRASATHAPAESPGA